MEDDEKVEDEANKSDVSSLDVGNVDDDKAKGEETPNRSKGKLSFGTKSIPPPGTGQKIYEIDPLLKGFRDHLDYR